MCSKYSISVERALSPVACPGIRMGGGGDENLKGFFFVLFNFSREGPAQKIPDKIIFPGACPGIRKRGGGAKI